MLPMVMVAREAGLRRAYVPSVDAHEAVLVDGVEVVPVATLAGLVDQLRGHAPTELAPPFSRSASPEAASATAPPGGDLSPRAPPTEARPAASSRRQPGAGPVDFRHVRGQAAVKRALEVAAAGGHNLLTIGSDCPRVVRAA
jgi:magnesium chelatase family protein